MDARTIVERVGEYIADNSLLRSDAPVLVALSGGADSVALLRVLLALGYQCVAAHCNFGLRGSESQRDEDFVRSLCHEHGIELYVTRFDVAEYRRGHKVSVEVACRELRYNWFAGLATDAGAQAVAVAHHRDDNVETLMLNLLRGTGLAGLTAMAPSTSAAYGGCTVVRPLLDVARGELETFLDDIGQNYVTDSTNRLDDFTRNKVRNIVLPVIDDTFPGARQAIQSTISHLREQESLYNHMIGLAAGRLRSSDGLRLWHALDYPEPKLVLHRLLRDYGFTLAQCHDIALRLGGDLRDRPRYFAAGYCLTLTGDIDVLEPIADDGEAECVVDLNSTAGLPVALTVSRDNPPFNPSLCDGRHTVAFSAELLNARRLVLRHWRRGDRMAPFGMRGKRQLLSDLFAAHNLTVEQKKRVWLLEADGQIIWALTLRAAQSFTVAPGSTHYLLLSTP